MKLFPLLLWLAFAAALLAIDTRAESPPDGGGLVIYKEQAFYADNLAGAMIYTKSFPRGPRTTLFVGAGGEQALVPSDGILTDIASEAINITELSPGPSLNLYKGTIGRLEELSHLNAKVASVATPVLVQMKTNSEMVESGKALVHGQWVSQPKQNVVPQPTLMTLTTTDGDAYKDATYKSSDSEKVRFTHADGVAQMSWDKLKKEDQLAWGFDAEKIKAEKLAKEQAEAAAKQREAEARAKVDKIKQEYLAQKKADDDALAKTQAQIQKDKLADEQKAAQEKASADKKSAADKKAIDELFAPQHPENAKAGPARLAGEEPKDVQDKTNTVSTSLWGKVKALTLGSGHQQLTTGQNKTEERIDSPNQSQVTSHVDKPSNQNASGEVTLNYAQEALFCYLTLHFSASSGRPPTDDELKELMEESKKAKTSPAIDSAQGFEDKDKVQLMNIEYMTRDKAYEDAKQFVTDNNRIPTEAEFNSIIAERDYYMSEAARQSPNDPLTAWGIECNRIYESAYRKAINDILQNSRPMN